MLTRVLNLALAAALALAVAKFWQFRSEPPPQLPGVEKAAVAGRGVSPERTPPPAAEEVRPEAFDVIVARDLFSPTRGVVPPEPVAASLPTPPAPQPPRLTLYGVVILDGDKSAFLQEGSQGERPRKVREGESFAGGTIREIRPDGVTFLFDGREIPLLLRSPKEAAAGSPVPRVVGATRRDTAPVTFPRRQSQPGAIPGQARPGGSQGRIPAPLSQIRATAGASRVPSPTEPAGDELEGGEIEQEPYDEGDTAEPPPEEIEE